MLVELCVLYTVASLLFVGPLVAERSAQGILPQSLAMFKFALFLPFIVPGLHLIGITNRSSVPSSLFYELPTGLHRRMTLSPLGTLVHPIQESKEVDRW